MSPASNSGARKREAARNAAPDTTGLRENAGPSSDDLGKHGRHADEADL